MSKKINLEEILTETFDTYSSYQFISLNKNIRSTVLKAMKEACKQTIELAAENANFGICQNDGGCPCIQESHFIDKQSILDTTNQIE